MSGILNRVHVFKEDGKWWIESPSGQAFSIPGAAPMEVVQAEAVTLHDHPALLHMLTTTDMIMCPICVRLSIKNDCHCSPCDNAGCA